MATSEADGEPKQTCRCPHTHLPSGLGPVTARVAVAARGTPEPLCAAPALECRPLSACGLWVWDSSPSSPFPAGFRLPLGPLSHLGSRRACAFGCLLVWRSTESMRDSGKCGQAQGPVGPRNLLCAPDGGGRGQLGTEREVLWGSAWLSQEAACWSTQRVGLLCPH